MEEQDYTIYNEEEQLVEENTPQQLQTEEEQPAVEKQETQEKRKLWSSIFTEGESLGEGSFDAKELVMGMHMNPQWVLRQLPLLGIILLGFLGSVTIRYMAQQGIIEKAKLENEVDDWKFRSITRSSELTDQTRQSQIEALLLSRGDSTLTSATEPPYTINEEE